MSEKQQLNEILNTLQKSLNVMADRASFSLPDDINPGDQPILFQNLIENKKKGIINYENK